MPISELTSRSAVEQAIEECDLLGRDDFLKRYGYRHAREYLLRHKGREYDSKAIAGVAYLKQYPSQALGAEDFSGGVGEAGAATVLKRLGFEVEEISSRDPKSSS